MNYCNQLNNNRQKETLVALVKFHPSHSHNDVSCRTKLHRSNFEIAPVNEHYSQVYFSWLQVYSHLTVLSNLQCALFKLDGITGTLMQSFK